MVDAEEVARGYEHVVRVPKRERAKNLSGQLGMGFLCARLLFIFISLDPSERNHPHGDSVLDIRSSSGEKPVSKGGESVSALEFRSTDASISLLFWSMNRLWIVVFCSEWHFYSSCDPIKRTHHRSISPLPVTTKCEGHCDCNGRRSIQSCIFRSTDSSGFGG
jgi:hypothetical protein